MRKITHISSRATKPWSDISDPHRKSRDSSIDLATPLKLDWSQILARIRLCNLVAIIDVTLVLVSRWQIPQSFCFSPGIVKTSKLNFINLLPSPLSHAALHPRKQIQNHVTITQRRHVRS
jgi:hypothetical protein